jgi:hypothetical protein
MSPAPVDMSFCSLANAVDAADRLQLRRRVRPRLYQHHVLRLGQVQA